MQDFEKLGVFYLGRAYDLAAAEPLDELLLYDSKDLTTHAVCVGMTGSGKTGLCLDLLEEAAIDGVPAIAIDPKGDLGNLLLSFPLLRPEDFRPWVDESEAARKGISVEELAAQTAQAWRDGLGRSGQDPARIQRFRDSADVAIYTPGSSSGLQIGVLRSFSAPSAEVLADGDALREKIDSAVSGLLTLLGVEADPVRGREHILLAQLLDRSWKNGVDLDLSTLIQLIQSPTIDRIGMVDLDTFFPAKERFELAIRLNNLLASPSFAGWMQGEPLDIGRLLHSPSGKPRLSILSIAHLSDAERMFFVTILLGEVLSWMRSQSGTNSLRAILYMDEVFGYFPPSANPPSKIPMLTLLKQARAFGLGIVLATQNPVDLDYKGLSNAGTWFLGRLQTERDKARVIEGLEGASAAAGAKFDRARMEAILAGLGNRVFLMNNVHEDQPVVFQSRFCLSYLRGPLTRGQIQSLMAPLKQSQATEVTGGATLKNVVATTTEAAGASVQRPMVPAEIAQVFLSDPGAAEPASAKVYRPALFTSARLHYVDAKSGIDQWRNVRLVAESLDETADDVWAGARSLDDNVEIGAAPEPGAKFAPVPAALMRAKSYSAWQKSLAAHLYRNDGLRLWKGESLGEISRAGESESAFRVRLQHLAREQRDEAVQKLRKKYAVKFTTLDNQIRRATDRIEREKSQFQSSALQTALAVGSSILRAVLGRKALSSTTVTSATAAARSAGRTASQRGDIGRAAGELEALQQKQADLQAQIDDEIADITTADQIELTEYRVPPRKSDIAVESVALAWVR